MRFLGDKELRKQMGDRGALAVSGDNWNSIREKFLNILEPLAQME